MPSLSEVLKHRDIVTPVGQRVGFTPPNIASHAQGRQKVATVVAELSDGSLVLDLHEANALRITNGLPLERRYFDTKTGRVKVDPNITPVT